MEMKKRMIISNTGQVVGKKMVIADSFFARFRGWMLIKERSDDDGLLLTKTKQVHTCWMRFSIDVVYLKKIDQDKYIIVALEEKMKPWRIGKYINSATDVLELNAGTIERNQLRYGLELIMK